MVVQVAVSWVWYDVVCNHELRDDFWHVHIDCDTVTQDLCNHTDISANIWVKVALPGLSRKFQLLQVTVLPMQ